MKDFKLGQLVWTINPNSLKAIQVKIYGMELRNGGSVMYKIGGDNVAPITQRDGEFVGEFKLFATKEDLIKYI